jgi:hypothetical protein
MVAAVVAVHLMAAAAFYGGRAITSRRATRGQEGGATRGITTTSRCKMMRGQRSERTTRGQRDERQPTTSWRDETTRGQRSEIMTRGRECGTMRGRDGGTTRGSAATIRHDLTTRGRCNKRTLRGDGNVTTSRRSEKTGGRRDKRTRGPPDGRRLKNQLARQEDKRGEGRDDERAVRRQAMQQPAGASGLTKYCHNL